MDPFLLAAIEEAELGRPASPDRSPEEAASGSKDGLSRQTDTSPRGVQRQPTDR
jgi:hypothetical protein